MALTFSQGRQSGQAPFRSRYADLDYTAADAFKPFKDQVDTQKKKVDEKIDAFRKAREEMDNVSDTSMWGEHYDTLKKKQSFSPLRRSWTDTWTPRTVSSGTSK